MSHEKRGKLLWICNYSGFKVPDKKLDNRDGWIYDIRFIEEVFGSLLGFEIVKLENQTAFQMYRAIYDCEWHLLRYWGKWFQCIVD